MWNFSAMMELMEGEELAPTGEQHQSGKLLDALLGLFTRRQSIVFDTIQTAEE